MDIAVIIISLLLMLWVGIRFGGGVTTMKGYAVGNKTFSTGVLLATIFATLIGGGAMLGNAEKAYTVGVLFIMATLAVPINKIILARFVAPKIKSVEGAMSVGEVMGVFYGNIGQVVTGVAAVLMSGGYIGMQVIALGYMSEALIGFPYEWAVVIGMLIIIAYSSYGGIKAVTATDVLQFGLLLLVVPILCIVGILEIGGLSDFFNNIPEDRIDILADPHLSLKYLGFFLFWLIPTMDPSFVQRLLMARDTKQIRTSMYGSAVLTVPFVTLVGAIGLIGLVLYPDIDPHQVLPYMIKDLLPVGIRGLVIVGVFSAVMSSADSDLNAGSVAFTNDVYKPLFNSTIKDRSELRLAQVVSVGLGLFAILCALVYRNIIDLFLGIASVWAPVVLAPLFAGLWGLRQSGKVFAMAVSVGIATYCLWELFLVPQIGLGGLVPSLLANALTLWVFSKNK